MPSNREQKIISCYILLVEMRLVICSFRCFLRRTQAYYYSSLPGRLSSLQTSIVHQDTKPWPSAQQAWQFSRQVMHSFKMHGVDCMRESPRHVTSDASAPYLKIVESLDVDGLRVLACVCVSDKLPASTIFPFQPKHTPRKLVSLSAVSRRAIVCNVACWPGMPAGARPGQCLRPSVVESGLFQ